MGVSRRGFFKRLLSREALADLVNNETVRDIVSFFPVAGTISNILPIFEGNEASVEEAGRKLKSLRLKPTPGYLDRRNEPPPEPADTPQERDVPGLEVPHGPEEAPQEAPQEAPGDVPGVSTPLRANREKGEAQ